MADKTPEQLAAEAQIEAQKAEDARRQAALTAAGSAALAGPGTGQLDISGSEDQRRGAVEGLQFGQMLYGQGIADTGKEAADYSSRVKGRLGADYAQADLYRQGANRRLAQGAGKLGMAGQSLSGAQEQNYRQSGMQAEAMNQDYQDKALALYGRNISAKQQGLAGQYQAGKGVGAASTPGQTPNYDSGLSVICTELYKQGKISKHEYYRSTFFGYTLKQETYFGYLTMATPVVELMKKSDKFSNLWVGWAKSIAAHKPNLFARIMLPLLWMVGYVRKITKKEITRKIKA